MDYETLFMNYVTEMAWIESERDGSGGGKKGRGAEQENGSKSAWVTLC